MVNKLVIVKGKVGWSQSGPITCGNKDNPVLFQVNFPDNQADYFTVQFGVSQALFPTGPHINIPVPFDVYAILQFKVEGNVIQRIVSVNNGTTISAPGEALAIRVVDNTVYPGSLGAKYTVTIQVTPGTRPNTEQPATLYWSYPIDTNNTGFSESQIIAPGDELIVPVPTKTGVISFNLQAVGNSATGANIASDVTVNQLASSIQIAQVSNPEPTEFVSLVASASNLQIENNDQTNPVTVAINWGIDG